MAPSVCSPRFCTCGTPRPSMVDEEMGMPAKRELSMRQLRHLLRLHHDGEAGRAGLGGAGARAETTWRHDDDPLGGIPRGPSRGLRLQPVLRPAPRVRAAADAGDAPAP